MPRRRSSRPVSGLENSSAPVNIYVGGGTNLRGLATILGASWEAPPYIGGDALLATPPGSALLFEREEMTNTLSVKLLYPIFKYILPLFSKKAASRVNFEMKNSINVSALGRASYGFEVSSEGELEQVRFLIFHLLKMDETVEIIFCSDSVAVKNSLY